MSTIARLRNVPTSPRKMRTVVDLIRGKRVGYALNELKYQPKVGARYIEKLLLSAVANWQVANEDESIEDADLYVKSIMVDSGRVLKRLRPAPQGRAHRIRKRSNHVTIELGSLKEVEETKEKKEVKKDTSDKKPKNSKKK